jgi:molybdopterin-containing oxidoreductase family iron-sulfur binding subunit
MKLAYGRARLPLYSLDQARVVVALESDFLMSEGDNVVAAKGFAAGRHVNSVKDEMNRLYVVESAYSVTGAAADHRLRVRPSEIAPLVLALAIELNKQGLKLDGLPEKGVYRRNERWLGAVARDLLVYRDRSVLMAGRHQPAEVHALVAIINESLSGHSGLYSTGFVKHTTHSNTVGVKDLTARMDAGEIGSLVVLGGNPVYDTPVDLEFSRCLRKVANSIHLSLHRDETSRACVWHLPMAHFLESWCLVQNESDQFRVRSVMQPLIEPLHGGKSTVELLNLLATGSDQPGYDVVRKPWERFDRADFEKNWRRTLHDGVFLLEYHRVASNVMPDAASALDLAAFNMAQSGSGGIEAVFASDYSTHDGRFANNGWLQEIPDPITKLTWDNAALISPATADKQELHNGDIVTLQLNGRSVEIPVWIVPGQADSTVVLPLGYGRQNVGRIADGVGVDTYALRTSDALHFATGATMTKTGRRRDDMANTQDHSSMEGRPIIREATLEEYRKHPEFAREMVKHPPLVSLWDEHDYSQGHQWGMAIDLNACIGCNACAVACQAENNVPIVGREQVGNGREMHWLRIDRYFGGDEDDPQMRFQPVACQHCENAPCEQVCPVAATVHDKEGLNTMVYNRCIGTRYCSNNCPYKVRRFNFFNFTKDLADTVKMAQNPDVTVRARGVMEKCTYCLQRINRARREAKLANTMMKDGDVVTACQQACPTSAIVFGDVNDPDSEVSQVKRRNRNYELLAELNVKPRTSFLARLRNPNPELEEI